MSNIIICGSTIVAVTFVVLNENKNRVYGSKRSWGSIFCVTAIISIPLWLHNHLQDLHNLSVAIIPFVLRLADVNMVGFKRHPLICQTSG